MVAPASAKASVVVPVAPVVVVGGTVVVVVATVVVVDDVVEVEGESTVVVVPVTTGPATLGEHAVARASTHISQTPRLPDPMLAMCVLRTTRAFWSGADSSAVDESVGGAHMADGMQADAEDLPFRRSGESRLGGRSTDR